ncbi:MAG: methyltransferase domain-containing protein [Gammaproteobacteria bacterium]
MAEHYIIGGGAAGSERLRVLADATWPTSEIFLREAGLAEGAKVLDAGCGNGAITLRIAARAGAVGRVTGLDRDAEMIRIARDEAKARGLAVEFRHGDIEHGAPAGDGYDLVYARLLLSHLGDPAAALARFAAALRPGGVLALEDVDFQGHFCHPASPAFERYLGWYEAAAIMRGADPRIGRRLRDMLLDAGLQDVKLRVVLPTFYEGEGKQMAFLTLRGIRDAVLDAGIASAEEFDRTASEIETFTRAPRSIMSLPRFFQAWGVRA